MSEPVQPEIDFGSLMQQMLAAIPPEKFGKVKAVIQLNVLGEPPQAWFWSISDGTCTVQAGNAENPSLILEANEKDFRKIISGKLNPMTANGLGRLDVRGDISLAVALAPLFQKKPEMPGSAG